MTMQITHRQGWYTLYVEYAKTHEHVKNDYAKTHGLAMWSAYQYLKGDKI